MEAQTVSISGRRYVIIEKSEYERLRKSAVHRERRLPDLPCPDKNGFYPAVETLRMVLARKVILQRQAAGLSRAEVARFAKVSTQTLSRIEQGKSSPSEKTIHKIFQILGKH